MTFIKSVRLERELFDRDTSYLRGLPLLHDLSELRFASPVTYITGDNGTGKSTLIEGIAVACGFNAEGGSKNFSFATRPSHSNLAEYLTVVRGTEREKDGWFLRAESFFNVATNIEQLDRQPAASRKIIEGYGGVSLHEQSHGESFFSLMKNRFTGQGLYILDEPEAALSPSRMIAMLMLMRGLADDGAQFIIATHSPILMAYPDAVIYETSERGIQLTDYKKTGSYLITKRFLSDPVGEMSRIFSQL